MRVALAEARPKARAHRALAGPRPKARAHRALAGPRPKARAHRALAVLAVLAAVPPTASAWEADAATTRAPTAVGVGEREWRIALYRSQVPAGRVRFNVRNFGEDGHDLALRNRAGKLLGRLPELRPDATGRLTVRLRRPGRYVVFCTLEGHEARGMRAVLRVKRRARG